MAARKKDILARRAEKRAEREALRAKQEAQRAKQEAARAEQEAQQKETVQRTYLNAMLKIGTSLAEAAAALHISEAEAKRLLTAEKDADAAD